MQTNFDQKNRPRRRGAAVLALACAVCNAAQAQQSATSPRSSDAALDTNNVVRLPEVVVHGRHENLVGVAESATQGTVGREQLQERPTLRPGEILETVPGVIVSQHSGEGKANQYYLRGFNLDHGTDFATYFDGVPVNMPTHGHGQGYSDINFVIQDLVQGIQYKKGPYYADEGDFSSAGAAHIRYVDYLPKSLLVLERGSFGYGRGVFASSPQVGPGHLLYGLELYHNDGPWEQPDDYQKLNGVLRYSQGDSAKGYSVTATAYHGTWNATDQIPKRAVEQDLISRFDEIDDTDGGRSQRYNLYGEWHRQDEQSATKVTVYGFYYDLDLWSNFTYFLDDPINGDQFKQHDRRWVQGTRLSHTIFSQWWGRDVENTVGLQVRNDLIRNSLSHTAERDLLSVTRADRVIQTSVSPYLENRVQWAEKFRSVAGLRGDVYRFDVRSDDPLNSGDVWDGLASPKLGLIFGPWAKTEFYVNGGLGFHSNDGRGATTRVDPGSGDPVEPVDPLVRTYGAEVGARTAWVPNLQSTLSLWALDIDSELLFVGDAGTVEASRPSRRYGVEFANYYQVTKWLTLDADFSVSKAGFRDDAPEGRYIPGAVETVVAAGASFHDLYGFFGELRLRYFGPRALVEDNSRRSGASALVNGRVGYEFVKDWSISVEVFNIFDSEVSDIDYFYTSRLPGEPVLGVDDTHFHPSEPRSFRLALTGRF